MKFSPLSTNPVTVYSHGHKWGRWALDTDSCVLFITDRGYRYEVDLERVTGAVSALDWIIQLSHKVWVSEADIGNLVRALDALACFQRTVCGGAMRRDDKKLQWDTVEACFVPSPKEDA